MGKQTKHRPYELKLYDPTWAKQFLVIASTIKPIFGINLISIEHVGSTSIACSDMIAKPNIDICVVVNNLDLIPNLYEDFKKLGYTPLGREYVGDGDEYIVKDNPDTGQRLESIHIYENGHPKPKIYRNFRDYLMLHRADRLLYIKLKNDLYEQHKDNYKNYDSGKTDLIEEIKRKANEWAENHITKNSTK